ncbi:MAG: DUF5667 domain-containing protein [Patescibacteria group bacterium]
MTKTAPNPVLMSLLLVFAFSVLGVSLISASIGNSALTDTPFSSRKIRFSSQNLPGTIFYPFTVVRDKVALLLMSTADQCLQRLQLASQRLSQAGHLIELGDTELALETMVKGQRYITEATSQCQQNQLSIQYQESVRTTITQYQQKLQEMKQFYPDTDRAVIDQLISENNALLLHLTAK